MATSRVETDIQFLARMLVAVREGEQIAQEDSDHLGNLANFGPGPYPVHSRMSSDDVMRREG